MGQVTSKGEKAPREDVRCEECGALFNRCVYHPYITRCNKCRKTRAKSVKVARAWGCKHCEQLVQDASRGMFVCPEKSCQAQWWILGHGYYKTYGAKIEMVFLRGNLIGHQTEYGSLRKLLGEDAALFKESA